MNGFPTGPAGYHTANSDAMGKATKADVPSLRSGHEPLLAGTELGGTADFWGACATLLFSDPPPSDSEFLERIRNRLDGLGPGPLRQDLSQLLSD